MQKEVWILTSRACLKTPSALSRSGRSIDIYSPAMLCKAAPTLMSPSPKHRRILSTHCTRLQVRYRTATEVRLALAMCGPAMLCQGCCNSDVLVLFAPPHLLLSLHPDCRMIDVRFQAQSSEGVSQGPYTCSPVIGPIQRHSSASWPHMLNANQN